MMDEAASLTATPNIFERQWRRWTLLIWLMVAIGLVIWRWNMIHWFNLPDTDDNMRMMQVRGLLNGQGWFDLRQHALNPPYGANIHWSRLVDLPIAGLILLFKPFVGSGNSERIAAAIAPMLPFLVAMLSMGAVVRRLVAPLGYFLAIFLMCCGFAALSMFSPMRIDHHGWQLAFLVMTMAGVADEQRARGGLLIGLASAASLTIGLEMIAFLAIAGGAVVLRWVMDAGEAVRLKSYAASLAAGTAFGYLVFASNDNRLFMCDALSPVWLSVMLGAATLALVMGFVPARTAWLRLGLAVVAAVLIAAGFVYFWPDCLGRRPTLCPGVPGPRSVARC